MLDESDFTYPNRSIPWPERPPLYGTSGRPVFFVACSMACRAGRRAGERLVRHGIGVLALLCLAALSSPAAAQCALTAGTWECSGTIFNVRLNQSSQFFVGGNGITIGTGDISIHILSGALVTNAFSGGVTVDGITNNIAGPSATSLVIVNDGTVQAISRGGGNFGADLALNASMGSVTIVNNGSWTGYQVGMTIRSTYGSVNVTNNATGIVRGSIRGVDFNAAQSSTLTNWGEITATDPGNASAYAIITAAENDSIYLMGGSVSGRTFTGAGDDLLEWRGGTVAGNIYMYTGSDTMLVTAATYDGSQVLDGGDDVAVADGWIDRLTFRGLTATAPGANLVNWESLTLDATRLTISDGALTVGSDSGMGLFLSNGSTLDGLNAFALTGNMTIDATSTFEATGGGVGVYSVSGLLANAGTVNMRDGAAGDRLTVGGNYVSNGGRLLIDTYLGADASATDRLVIRGNSVLGSGATSLLVTNTTGGGAQTTGDGIRVVQVDGASGSGAFVLGNRVAAGAYEYLLYHNGVGANAGDGDWYLRSTLIPTTTTTTTTTPSTPRRRRRPSPSRPSCRTTASRCRSTWRCRRWPTASAWRCSAPITTAPVRIMPIRPPFPRPSRSGARTRRRGIAASRRRSRTAPMPTPPPARASAARLSGPGSSARPARSAMAARGRSRATRTSKSTARPMISAWPAPRSAWTSTAGSTTTARATSPASISGRAASTATSRRSMAARPARPR